MKPYLRIKTQHFAAGETTARLPIAGNFLRVLSSGEPVSFVLGDGADVELVPGMGVQLDETQAFQELRITRTAPVAAAPLDLQIAYGWQPADRLPVITDNRAVADIKNSNAVQVALTTPATAPTKSRFLGDWSAWKNENGVGLYYHDPYAPPAIGAGQTAALGLIAPASTKVKKRIVRLLTAGVTLNIGTDWPTVDMGAGFVAVLNDAAPQVEIPGGGNLYGKCDSAANYSVLEEVETDSTGYAAPPATPSYPADATALTAYKARPRFRVQLFGTGQARITSIITYPNASIVGTSAMRVNGVACGNDGSGNRVTPWFNSAAAVVWSLDITSRDGSGDTAGAHAACRVYIELSGASGELRITDESTGTVVASYTGVPAGPQLRSVRWDTAWQTLAG